MSNELEKDGLAGAADTEAQAEPTAAEKVLEAARAGMSSEEFIAALKQDLGTAKAQVPKKSIGTKVFIVIIALLVVLGIVRAVQLQNETTEDESLALTNVATAEVAKGSIEITSPLAGRIQAKDTISVIPMASGEVTSLSVKEGDYVQAGQVLFTIDDTQAQIQYSQALVGVQTYEDSLESLETTYERTKALYEAGAASKSDLDSVEDSITSMKSQLANARLSAQAASESLSYYTVTAPSSGYVTSLSVVVGGIAGQSVAAVISDTSTLELSASVSEYMISNIHVGDTVDVYVESASDEPFEGTIATIAEAPSQGTYTYPITVTVKDPDQVIKAGMFAEVRLISARKENVIAVSTDAIITSGDEKKVVILNDDGTVSYRVVTVGIDNGVLSEITDGLSVGEKIVVKGQTYVKDGEKVRVVE